VTLLRRKGGKSACFGTGLHEKEASTPLKTSPKSCGGIARFGGLRRAKSNGEKRLESERDGRKGDLLERVLRQRKVGGGGFWGGGGRRKKREKEAGDN